MPRPLNVLPGDLWLQLYECTMKGCGCTAGRLRQCRLYQKSPNRMMEDGEPLVPEDAVITFLPPGTYMKVVTVEITDQYTSIQVRCRHTDAHENILLNKLNKAWVVIWTKDSSHISANGTVDCGMMSAIQCKPQDDWAPDDAGDPPHPVDGMRPGEMSSSEEETNMDTTEAAERDRRQLLQKKRAAAGRIDMPGDVTLPRGDQPVRGMWNTVDDYPYGKPGVPWGRGHGRMSPPTRNGGTATPAASAGDSAAPACSASGGHPAGLQPASFKEPPPIKAGSKAPPPPPPPRRERRRGGGGGRPFCGGCKKQRPGERVFCLALNCHRRVGPGCTPGCLRTEFPRVARRRFGWCMYCPATAMVDVLKAERRGGTGEGREAGGDRRRRSRRRRSSSPLVEGAHASGPGVTEGPVREPALQGTAARATGGGALKDGRVYPLRSALRAPPCLGSRR